MHDIKQIRDSKDIFIAGLAKRAGFGPEKAEDAVAKVLELDNTWRGAKAAFEQHRARQNEASRAIGAAKASFKPRQRTYTTAVAATRLGRDWVGIELNATYRALALDRIAAMVVRDRTRPQGGDAQPKGHHHEPTQERAA